MHSASEPQPENYSRTYIYKPVLMANSRSQDPQARRFPSAPSLQQLPSGEEVSEILQQMCGEISRTTTAEIVEVANSAAPRNKLQDLLPVYFYSWQLQSPDAVIICLLLNYFILWRDGREDRQAFEEYIERLKTRVAELEKKPDASQSEIRKTKAELEETDPEINRLTKQVQDLKMENEKLQSAHDEVSACPSVIPAWLKLLYSLYALYTVVVVFTFCHVVDCMRAHFSASSSFSAFTSSYLMANAVSVSECQFILWYYFPCSSATSTTSGLSTMNHLSKR